MSPQLYKLPGNIPCRPHSKQNKESITNQICVCELHITLPWLIAISLGTYGTEQNKQLTKAPSHIWSVKKKSLVESRMSNLTQRQAMNDINSTEDPV